MEIISQHDLQKYINLAYDTPQAHKPYATGILLIELNEHTEKVKSVRLKEVFDEYFAKLLEDKLSLKNLFFEIENYKNFIQYQE